MDVKAVDVEAMDMDAVDLSLAAVAGAIADPARARMLCSLLDGHARTATELAAVADIGASAASGHFSRLRDQGLVEMLVQGRHRYYRLAGTQVARALEALLAISERPPTSFRASTPSALKHARTCYDHCAGKIAVQLHDALLQSSWIEQAGKDYRLSEIGAARLAEIGIDVQALSGKRRRLAYPCMDWSERSPHIGGALGAALLELMLKRGWANRHLDSRALSVTSKGSDAMARLFAVRG